MVPSELIVITDDKGRSTLPKTIGYAAVRIIDCRDVGGLSSIFGLILQKAFRTIRPIFRERAKINAEVTGRLTESLGGVRVVKGYHAEEREHEVVQREIARVPDAVLGPEPEEQRERGAHDDQHEGRGPAPPVANHWWRMPSEYSERRRREKDSYRKL